MSIVQGLILGRTGTTVVVSVDGEELPPIALARHLHDTSQAAAGDACLIGTVHGAKTVIAVLGAAPAPPTPAPPPPAEGGGDGTDTGVKPPTVERTGSSPVRPVWTGTYRGGWRTDTADLYQGDWTGRGLNTGAAFYGNGFRAWDELTRVTVALRRKAGAGVFAGERPRMVLLAGGTRPGGAPTILAAELGPSLTAGGSGGSGSWDVPESWLPQLMSGAAGGIGIHINSRDPYLALETGGGGMAATAYWRDT